MAIYVWPQKTQMHTERIPQKAFLLYRFTFCENLCHSVAETFYGHGKVKAVFMATKNTEAHRKNFSKSVSALSVYLL
jgi:hypothetical protein